MKGLSPTDNDPYNATLYALCRQSYLGGVIPVVLPTGMSYLFYYTEQNTKPKRGKNDKHQRFWINTRRLPC